MANDVVKEARHRIQAVRLRTWVISITILISLGFWLVLKVTTRDSISWIDFVMLCIIQMLGHFAYFPDGELYGQTDETFKANRNQYNKLADQINNDRKFEQLREYCAVEYEERKQNYITTMLGYVGITEKEFEEIKLKDAKEIKKIEDLTITENVNGEEQTRVIHFNKKKRKILYDLIFKPIPVQRNEAGTIVSGKEIDSTRKVKDETKSERARMHISKLMKIATIGLLLAYISWNVRDNFGWGDVARLVTFTSSLLTTAIMSFTSGERLQKVYKNAFYIDLVQFINRFQEWETKHHV